MQAILTVTDTKAVCLCVTVLKDGHYRIEAQSEEAFSPIRRNKPVLGLGIRTAVQKAVALAQKQAGKRIEQVHTGVPGAFCQTLVLFEGHEDDEASLNGYLYGDQRYELIERYRLRGRQTVMILALRDYTAEMNAALKALHLKPGAFYAQTQALGIYLIPRSMREQVAILLDIGYYHSDICVFMGEGQVFSAGMFLGGGHITSDLTQILELEPSIAEQLKRQFAFGIRMDEGAMAYIRMPDGKLASFEHSLVEDVITARMDETCALIRETLEHSRVEFTDMTRVYLSGEGIRGMQGMREYFGSRLGFAVEALPLEINDGITRQDPIAIALCELVMRTAKAQTKKFPRPF